MTTISIPRRLVLTCVAGLLFGVLAPAAAAAPGDRLWTQAFPTDQQWTAVDGLVAVSRGTGDVYLAGTIDRGPSSFDWVVVKYTAAGAFKWVRYHGGGSDDRVFGIAADRGGNIIVCGERTGGTAGDTSFAVVKWSRTGRQVWAKHIDGTAGGADVARAVTVDDAGNVYVTGAVVRAKTGSDVLTVKYGPTGRLLWQRHHSTTGRFRDGGWALARDDKGRLYVAAEARRVLSRQDVRVLRYSAGGWLDWRFTWGNVDGDDIPLDIAVSTAGVAVSGQVLRRDVPQGIVIKLGLGGKGGWRKTYTMFDDGVVHSTWPAVGIDTSGRVTVAGSVLPVAEGRGEKSWVHRFSRAGTLRDQYAPTGVAASGATDIAVSGAGAVYTTGAYEPSGSLQQGRTMAWDPAWTLLFDVLHPTDEYAMSREDACVLAGDALYVAGIGSDDQAGDGADLVLTKYQR